MAEGIRKIQFLVRTDVQPPALVRRVIRNLKPTVEPVAEEEIICRDVRSFSVKYFDGLAWQESWDSTTLGDVLPMSVAITLEVNDPTAKLAAAGGGERPPYHARFPAVVRQAGRSAGGDGRDAMTRCPSHRNRRGTVLIVAMIVSFALAATVLVLCRTMRVEAAASANPGGGGAGVGHRARRGTIRHRPDYRGRRTRPRPRRGKLRRRPHRRRAVLDHASGL
jgi:hypothetical protein